MNDKLKKIFEISLQNNLRERGLDVKVDIDVDADTCTISMDFLVGEHSLQTLANEIVAKFK